MDWKAKWIWHKGESAPRNLYWCVRKVFELPAGFSGTGLHITADSRYTVWVNGHYLGHGPVRGFTRRWRYDTHDIASYVAPGKNVIAVLVHHFGCSTFQHLHARGGLLAQIESDGDVIAATDSTWRGLPHPSYSRRTPRLSLQQGWAEHFDMRWEPIGWTLADFDDSQWENSVVVGDAGCDPWTELLPRDIPFLTQEALYPARLMGVRVVRPPAQVWSMDIRPNLSDDDRTSNKIDLQGLIATVLHCSEPMRLAVSAVHHRFRALFIDGSEVAWDQAKDGIDLDAGEHLFAVDNTGYARHEGEATFVFDYDGGELQFHQRGQVQPADAVLFDARLHGVGERHGLRFAVAGVVAGHKKLDPHARIRIAEVFATGE